MSKPLNILVVAGGRRYSFVERLKARGFKVWAYETSGEVPIASLCEEVLLPTKDDLKKQSEIEDIQAICEFYDIPYVLPLSDKMAVLCSELDNCIGHNRIVAETCYDKKKFDKYMKANYPSYYPGIEGTHIPAPAVIKPRFGNSSKDIRYHEDNGFIVLDDEKDVAQRYITGPEYSVDAYFDKFSSWAAICPRTRDRVAGGEVVDSITVDDRHLIECTRHIGRSLGMTGPACFQYRYDEFAASGCPQLFEINARFGGGCILSMEAGLRMIDYIKCEYYDDYPLYGEAPYKKGLKMRRVFRETFFHEKTDNSV